MSMSIVFMGKVNLLPTFITVPDSQRKASPYVNYIDKT